MEPRHAQKPQPVSSGGGSARLALLIGGCLLLVLIIVLAVLKPWEQPVLSVADAEIDEVTQSAQEMPQSEVPEPTPLEPLDFTILAGGDVLTHLAVANSAWTGQAWDFSPLMEPVQPYIAGADLALCNLETPLVPRDQEPTDYPIFGTPRDLADSLAATGWDGCSTSTNHSVDKGLEGVFNTLDFMDEAGLGHVGTARSSEEAEKPQFYTIDGPGQSVTVAHIAAADNTNGIPIPEEAPWSVQMIDIPVIEERARQARADGADIVVVSIHCCVAEYDTAVEPYQEEMAQQLASSGLVDIYVNHHAHVPRPAALLEGGPNGNGMWVAYGMGNFISNQFRETTESTESSTGMLAIFHGVKEEGEPARVVAAEWMVVTTDTGHVVRPLIGGVAEGAARSPEEMAYRYSLIQPLFEGGPFTEVTAPPSSEGHTTTVIQRSS